MKHNEPSQRQLRMGEQVKHVIVDTLQRGKMHEEVLIDCADITVAEVRMTPDLKQAKAYVSSILHDKIDRYLEALNKEAPYFQQEINRKTDTKFTPRITFVKDESQERVARLEAIFDEIESE